MLFFLSLSMPSFRPRPALRLALHPLREQRRHRCEPTKQRAGVCCCQPSAREREGETERLEEVFSSSLSFSHLSLPVPLPSGALLPSLRRLACCRREKASFRLLAVFSLSFSSRSLFFSFPRSMKTHVTALLSQGRGERGRATEREREKEGCILFPLFFFVFFFFFS